MRFLRAKRKITKVASQTEQVLVKILINLVSSFDGRKLGRAITSA